jgi:four helix bundle protein
MALQTHKDLKVWQESRNLVNEIYTLTSKFPKEEIYSLTAQIKRASISIPSNIAEGAARDSNKENIHFLYIALGSAAELDTQIEIARDLNFLSEDKYKEISGKLDKIDKMLSGLIRFRQTRR